MRAGTARRIGLVAGIAAALAAGTRPTLADADPLSGVVKTKRFEVRYRPGSRAGADAPRQAVAAERDLDRIAAALDCTPKGPFVLRLYDDVEDLRVTTKVLGNEGFSANDTSHVPYAIDQTRLHELVHLVAHEWPTSGPEPRNMWYAEGLANAVLEFVHGVHVHAVAAHYARAGKLPTIAEMTGASDAYAWMREHPGFDAYDVAASWMRFLLDAHGTAKVKRYYTGTPAKSAFGMDVPAAEKAWRAMLAAYDLRPEVETLLRMREGDPKAAFGGDPGGLPAAVTGTARDWPDLAGAERSPERPDAWRREKDALRGVNDADEWTACELGAATWTDAAVRARIRTEGYTPVEVRFGPENRVLFVFNGVHLFRGDAGIAADAAFPLPDRSTTFDVVVARRGTHVDVWVDRRKVFSTDAGTEGPRRVGVGVHRGSAAFEDVRVRALE